MHCASCASIIERTVRKMEGVSDISVNNGTEKAKISYDENVTSHDAFNKKLEPLGYSLETEIPDIHKEHSGDTQSKREKLKEIADMKSGVLSALPLAGISILIMAWEILGKYQIVPAMPETMYEFFHHDFLFPKGHRLSRNVHDFVAQALWSRIRVSAHRT